MPEPTPRRLVFGLVGSIYEHAPICAVENCGVVWEPARSWADGLPTFCGFHGCRRHPGAGSIDMRLGHAAFRSVFA